MAQYKCKAVTFNRHSFSSREGDNVTSTVNSTTYPADPTGSPTDYFPLDQPDPAPGTFEIGLVLGGTGSASCYTGGVLDFLIEALDQWEAAKQQDLKDHPDAPRVPHHKVLIRVVTGTSGGGLNAAIIARALRYRFPHIRLESSAADCAKNPFYKTFVTASSVDRLFDSSDVQASSTGIKSMMCAKSLHELMAEGLSFAADPAPQRPWVHSPLTLVLTFTNLSGIPYRQEFSGQANRPEYFINHADFVRVGVDVPNGLPGAVYRSSPDTFMVGDQAAEWSTLCQYAMGTAAFPFGFPAVQINRPAGDYRFRYVIPATRTQENTTGFQAGDAQPIWLKPDWSLLLPEGGTADAIYSFVTVDGGCVNLMPFGLADDVLSGISPTPSVSSAAMRRALILVDPFTERPKLAANLSTDLGGIVFPLFNCLMESNRYATADLSAFNDKTNYSRFLISAVGKDSDHRPLAGGDALATSGMGAFLGFMSEAYRRHDYLLGRRNCQKFLKSWFALPADAVLFAWPKPDPSAFQGERPIIPLYGSAAVEQEPPPAPVGVFKAGDVRAAIKGRVQALLPLAARGAISNPFLLWLLRTFSGVLSNGPTDKIVAAIQAEIDKSKLLNPKP
jgi:hypothetical protein